MDVDPDVYQNYVVNKGLQELKELYVQVNIALSRMLNHHFCFKRNQKKVWDQLDSI